MVLQGIANARLHIGSMAAGSPLTPHTVVYRISMSPAHPSAPSELVGTELPTLAAAWFKEMNQLQNADQLTANSCQIVLPTPQQYKGENQADDS